MGTVPNIPLSWLDEFKKSLRRGNQATPNDSQPVDDLASRRLTLPEATPNRVESAPRIAGPMDKGTITLPALPVTDLANARLSVPSESPPMSALGLSPHGTPNLASSRIESTAPFPFTARPEYSPTHQHGKSIGVADRILHALKGAGLGALQGMSHGGAMGGLGGAAAGGIGAGVNPEFYHKLKYNTRTLPEWRGRYEDEAAQAKTQDAEAESRARVANIGTDNDLAARRQASTEAAQQTNEHYRTDTLAEQRLQHHTVNAQAAKAEHDQRHPGEPYPPNVTEAMPWLKGERAPRTAAKAPGAPHTIEGGRLMWDATQQKMVPTPGYVEPPDKPPTQGEVFRETKADQREARASRREQRQQLDRAEGNLRRAQQAINNARMTSANKDATQDQIDKSWQSAGDIVDEMVSNHPDLLEGGKGTGDYPYIQWKGGRKPGVEAETSQPRSVSYPPLTKQSKVGSTYVHNGKVVKITGKTDQGFQLQSQ